MDPQNLIEKSPEGTMIFARFATSLSSQMQTGFFIRESQKYVSSLVPTPPVLVRAALLERNNVCPLVVMLKFREQMVYETWFNYYSAQVEYADMIGQNKLKIVFFTPKKDIALEINNSISSVFQKGLRRIKQVPQWRNRSFESARQSIYNQYNSVESLWEAINV